MVTDAISAQPPPPAFLIVDVTAIHDDPTYARYRAAVPATIAAAGGRYLARGGEVDVMEGGWQPSRLVVVRFPDAAHARAWWRSPSYAPLRALRAASISANFVLVAGITGELPR